MTDADIIERRILPLLYVIGGGIGLVAAFTLLVEKIELLKDPSYVPSCSINPILSCGSIMKTSQAEAFGFPNPIIGIIGFSVLITIGVLLLNHTPFPRWIWVGLQIGTTFAVVFVHWLIFQSLYRIDALCPYCMVVWVVTIPVFWYTTLCVMSPLIDRADAIGKFASIARRYHGAVLTSWFVAILALILIRFWDYWVTVLS